AAGAAGPELGASPDGTPFYRVGDYYLHGVKYAGSPFMDVDVRLAAMDAAGIDVQVLSPNPITYFNALPAAWAWWGSTSTPTRPGALSTTRRSTRCTRHWSTWTSPCSSTRPRSARTAPRTTRGCAGSTWTCCSASPTTKPSPSPR